MHEPVFRSVAPERLRLPISLQKRAARPGYKSNQVDASTFGGHPAHVGTVRSRLYSRNSQPVMPTRHLRFIQASTGLLLTGLLLLTGCQSCSTPDEKASAPVTPESEQAVEEDRGPRALATRYLDYAYRGALLSSDHPLNDSLTALTDGAIGGGQTITIIDTFHVETVQAVGDSGHAVRFRFPRSVEIESVSWTISAPVVDAQHTLRVRQNTVHDAPHVVGESAFKRHMTEVAPAAADSVLERTNARLERTGEPGV